MSATVGERPSGPYAVDGTEAHELVEYTLRERYTNAKEALVMSGMVWTHRTDDEDNRLASVQTMLDYVYELLDTYEDAELILEHTFTFPTKTGADAGGTNDVIIIVPSLNLMYVVDFKNGAGHAVEVEDNPQLMFYGVGACTDGGALQYDHYTVILTIVQPRAFHSQGPVREWLVPQGRLDTFVDEVDAAIEACEGESPALVPGPEQCRWCDASSVCPAIEKAALQAVSVNFASVQQITTTTLPTVRDVPADRLGEILAAKPILETWLKEAEEYAFELAMAGYTVPGRKLVEAQARRRYTKDDGATAEELMILAGADIDDVMPRTLIGITAGEKLVKDAYKAVAPRGKKKQAAEDAGKAFALLTTKDTSGTLTLVDAADRRQAVNRSAVNFATVALPPPINRT